VTTFESTSTGASNYNAATEAAYSKADADAQSAVEDAVQKPGGWLEARQAIPDHSAAEIQSRRQGDGCPLRGEIKTTLQVVGRENGYR
jgi:hypothetical protein